MLSETKHFGGWPLSLALISNLLIGFSFQSQQSPACVPSPTSSHSPWQTCLWSIAFPRRAWGCKVGTLYRQSSLSLLASCLLPLKEHCFLVLANRHRHSYGDRVCMLFPACPEGYGMRWMQPFYLGGQTEDEVFFWGTSYSNLTYGPLIFGS